MLIVIQNVVVKTLPELVWAKPNSVVKYDKNDCTMGIICVERTTSTAPGRPAPPPRLSTLPLFELVLFGNHACCRESKLFPCTKISNEASMIFMQWWEADWDFCKTVCLSSSQCWLIRLGKNTLECFISQRTLTDCWIDFAFYALCRHKQYGCNFIFSCLISQSIPVLMVV